MAQGKQATSAKPPLIAIIDDDDSMRAALSALLGSAGFSTRSFTTAEQFLRSRLRRSMSCLIIDIQLPGMSGLELREQLRRDGVDTPMILVTASVLRAAHLARRPKGASSTPVLQKPFADAKLLAAVRKALRRKRPGAV